MSKHCKRHSWALVQNPSIRMAYAIFCTKCGLRSEEDILLGEWDRNSLKRRLIRSALKSKQGRER